MLSWHSDELNYRKDCSSFFQTLLHLEYPIWLDSCAHATMGRYDVLSAQPYETLSQTTQGKVSASFKSGLSKETDFLHALESIIPNETVTVGDFVFTGVLGYFSYEFGVKRAGLSCTNEKVHQLPDAWFGLYSWAIIVDHHLKKAYLVSQQKEKATHFLKTIKNNWMGERSEIPLASNFSLLAPFQSNIAYHDYENAMAKIQTELRAGNTYQVNYSHCFSATYQGEPFFAYQLLRQKNPSEYAVFLQLPEGCLLSFSPELLVNASNDSLLTKPIKGTMARTFDALRDEAIKKTLYNCPKNRAENMMIVDLLRNDLSKVSLINTLKVERFLEIETMPSVFHLVSTISSSLSSAFTYFDVINALFPGGSITGAPKHRTMQLIETLETTARGIYCGSIGHLSPGHNMCFNIAIRTLTAANGILYCNAGGGIVLDSNCQQEYQETLDKVSFLTQTLQDIT